MDFTVEPIPVFVFPHCLEFYVDHKPSHKQILSIYNPYNFGVQFKVLSTAPDKYVVNDSEGSIGPKARVDLLVRHKMPISLNINVIDKFKISIFRMDTKKEVGKKIIESMLRSGEPAENLPETSESFQNIPLSNTSSSVQSYRESAPVSYATHYISFALVVCFVILYIDRVEEANEESFVPSYLRPSVVVKITAGIVLGYLGQLLQTLLTR